jgi:hypothetical protein
MRPILVLLCILGAVLPYSQLIPWVSQHGLDLEQFTRDLFANRISSFFAMDVFVSAAALFAFIAVERPATSPLSRWLPVLATLTVGVSLGLPLYLLLRHTGSTTE